MAGTLTILLSGCGATMAGGDAGCLSYGEARIAMPPPETLAELTPSWQAWIADTDDRMTGACR